MPRRSGTVYISEEFSNERPEKEVEEELEESTNEGLDVLVQQASQVIFETQTVFPFDLFPNKVIICVDKIIINYRGLFGRDQYSLLLENVTGARVTHNLYFSSLHIETFGIKDPPTPVYYLRNRDARLARRYILALIECKKAGVDLSGYDVEEVREKLRKLGKVREGITPD
jgi:hypothetical protein